MIFEFFKDFLYLTIELSLLFVGISFVVALAQKVFNEQKIKNILVGGHNYTSAIKGAAIGFLTPFCSCSAIPLLIALIQARAPFCATISYLLASPLLNPIVIILFIKVFGLTATIMYAILTYTFAVIFGLTIHNLGLENEVKSLKSSNNIPYNNQANIRAKAKIALEDCIDVFQKILPHLLLGAFVATLIHGFVPTDFIQKHLSNNQIFALPLAAIFGMPLHVHPSTLLPVADVLTEKEVPLGTIITLIISGAGISLPEITLLNGIFKKKILIIFILSVFFIAVISGYIFNLFFG